MQVVTQVLIAAINLIESRRVLRVDEHGKQIVWENDDFFIVANDLENATYLSLWDKSKQVSIGDLYISPGKEPETRGYATVSNVYILSKYRGLGLGRELYRQAARFISRKYKGLASEDNQRENQKQVPKIWKRLGAASGNGTFLLPTVTESIITEGLSITLKLLNLRIRRGEAEPLREAGKTNNSTMASALIKGETVVFVFSLDIKDHIEVTLSANRDNLRGKKLGVFARVEQALQAAVSACKNLEDVL